MKKVLVTGATKGIGAVIASALASEFHVFVTGRNETTLQKSGFRYYVCDLADENSLKSLAGFVEENDIDVLINNAGEYIYSPIDTIDLNVLNHIFKVNLEAPSFLISAVTKHMKSAKWGRIVNIGSISGVMGEANACLYSASKAGLIGLTKALALELAQDNITVNTINPGWVETELADNSIGASEFDKSEIIDCIPQKRFVEPIEVANLVKYLISEEAKGITGQSINLCAGLSVGT